MSAMFPVYDFLSLSDVLCCYGMCCRLGDIRACTDVYWVQIIVLMTMHPVRSALIHVHVYPPS